MSREFIERDSSELDKGFSFGVPAPIIEESGDLSGPFIAFRNISKSQLKDNDQIKAFFQNRPHLIAGSHRFMLYDQVGPFIQGVISFDNYDDTYVLELGNGEIIRCTPPEATNDPEVPTAAPDTTSNSKRPPVIVEEDAELGEGQMGKDTFLSQLESQLRATANAELEPIGRNADDCPYIDKYITKYKNRSALRVRKLFNNLLPETRDMGTAQEYIQAMIDRVKPAMRYWARTGNIPSNLSGILSWEATQKAKQSFLNSIGKGKPLESGVQSEMENVLKADLSDVRIHDDANAAAEADKQGAKAFTYGQDIVFGAGQYKPDTPEGKFTLFHETDHTVQQQGAKTEEKSDNEAATEAASTANTKSWAARLLGGAKSGLSNMITNVKSGLRVSKCGDHDDSHKLPRTIPKYEGDETENIKSQYFKTGLKINERDKGEVTGDLKTRLMYFSTDPYMAIAVGNDPDLGMSFYFLVQGIQKQLKQSNHYNGLINGNLTPEITRYINYFFDSAKAHNSTVVNYDEKLLEELLVFTHHIVENEIAEKIRKEKSFANDAFTYLVIQAQRYSGKNYLVDGKYSEELIESIRKNNLEKQAENLVNELNDHFNVKIDAYAALNSARIEALLFKEHIADKAINFAGNNFSLKIEKEKTKHNNHVDAILWITIEYTGPDRVTENRNVSFSLKASDGHLHPNANMIPAIGVFENPVDSVHDKYRYIMIQPYATPGLTILISDTVNIDIDTNPVTNHHHFEAELIGADKKRLMGDIRITPKHALPNFGNEDEFVSKYRLGKFAPTNIEGKTNLDYNSALFIALQKLKIYQELANNVSEPYHDERLQQFVNQIEAEVNQGADNQLTNKDTIRPAGLMHMAQYAKAKMEPLLLYTLQGAFPAETQGEINTHITYISELYSKAVELSYSNLESANKTLEIADKHTHFFPMVLSEILLQQDKGIETLGHHINDLDFNVKKWRSFSGHSRKYAKLEHYLGIENLQQSEVSNDLFDQLKFIREHHLIDRYSAELPDRTLQLFNEAQMNVGIFSLLSTYEMMRAFQIPFDKWYGVAIDVVLPDARREEVDEHEIVLAGFIERIEKLLSSKGVKQTGFKAEVAQVLKEFYDYVGSKAFTRSIEDIQKRISHIEKIAAAVKIIFVIVAAAIASSLAGPSGGMMVARMGGGIVAVSIAEFATEVLVFTIVSRGGNSIAFGGNEASFVQDLFHNAFMFGALRGVGKIHQSLFTKYVGDPAKYSKLFKISGAGTSMISLQAIADVQYRLESGKWMDGDERLKSLFFNAALFGAIHLGGFLTKGINEGNRAKIYASLRKNFAKKMIGLDARRSEIRTQINLLEGGKEADVDVAKLLEQIELQLTEEVSLLNKMLEKPEHYGLTKEVAQEVLENYKQRIIELNTQLAIMGFQLSEGTNQAVMNVEPGVIAVQDSFIENIKTYFEKTLKESGGSWEPIIGKDGNETGWYLARTQTETIIVVKQSKIRLFKGGEQNSDTVVIKIVEEAIHRSGNNTKKALDYIRVRLQNETAKEQLEQIIKNQGETATLEWLRGKENEGKDIEKELESAAKTNFTKYGQKLEDIGEVLEGGLVKGKYSGRPFNPSKAGGAIENLNWSNATITKEGIETVEKHLARFGPSSQNKKSVQRLRDILSGKISPTDYDLKFYTHEIQEYKRFRNLDIPDGVHMEEFYNPAHTATLEDFKIKPDEVYHPSTEPKPIDEINEYEIYNKWRENAIKEGKYIPYDDYGY